MHTPAQPGLWVEVAEEIVLIDEGGADVMYTVEQARGGVVHTPGFTANGPSPPGAHLGHLTDTARGPHPGTSHTPAITRYTATSSAPAHTWIVRARALA